MNTQPFNILRDTEGHAIEVAASRTTITYSARDPALEAPVHLRMLRPEFSKDSAAREVFLQHMRSAATLRHPGMLAVHALREDEDCCFCVHEPVEGSSLHDLVAERGILGHAEALEAVLDMAHVVEAAAASGLVFPDLCPENVRYVRRGRVKLASFHPVALSDALQGGALVTPPEDPEFSCPEILEGAPFDPRATSYSIGLILWVLVTGQPPFRGAADVVRARHLQGTLPLEEVNHLPPAVVELLTNLLQREPCKRPGPGRLVHAIDRARAMAANHPTMGGPSPVPDAMAPAPTVLLPPLTAARLKPGDRPRRNFAFAEAVVGLLVAILIYVVLNRPAPAMQGMQSPKPPDPPAWTFSKPPAP